MKLNVEGKNLNHAAAANGAIAGTPAHVATLAGKAPRASSAAGNGRLPLWIAAALVVAIAAGTYCTALAGLVGRWWTDPDYIHGFLVPVFSGYLLWHRRAMLRGAEFKGSAWGIAFLAVAAAMRMASSYYYYDLLDPASLVPCLAGIALLVGGWPALKWAWPAIAFLAFMVPLPGFLAGLMGLRLQRIATVASTFVIQTFGLSAVAEGNVIYLANSQVGVAEACSGLRNMMLFLTVCVGAVFISRRSVPEKIILVLSAPVIALVANVIRITATAIMGETAGNAAAHTLYHTVAQYFMMPLAVVLLWLELAYLNRIFVREPREEHEGILLEGA